MTTASLSSPCALLLSNTITRTSKPSLSLRPSLHGAGNGHLSLSSCCASSFSYNPLRFAVGDKGVKLNEKKNGRGAGGVVCRAVPFGAHNVQWISAVSSAVLMVANGTPVQKSFILPLFALQAPATIISWMKGEYGVWAAFLALLVRLFFHIPGELELPFMALLLVIVAPHQVMNLRGTQEGAIIAILIAAYMGYQHFSRTGLKSSFEQGSIVATVAVIGITIASLLLLI